jgi:hypothetical protein
MTEATNSEANGSGATVADAAPERPQASIRYVDRADMPENLFRRRRKSLDSLHLRTAELVTAG